MKHLAFFNNKGGVGKTTLVYHLAHAWADAGENVLIVDLDPQSNLTAMCVDEDRLEALWNDDSAEAATILGAVRPIMKGLGDIAPVTPLAVRTGLSLVPGHIGLSQFEDRLSDAWPRSMDGDEAAYRTLSAFHRIALGAAERAGATMVLLDVGPNLGAINRAALLGADAVVTPIAPDLFSMQGLRNLGPTLEHWRTDWSARLSAPRRPADVSLPAGTMDPLGYVVMQAGMRLSRPVKAYARWVARMPSEYHEHVVRDAVRPASTDGDPCCLGIMRHYQSLMPLAQDAQKPMFHLLPGDGAIGAHQDAVRRCREEFRALAHAIGTRLGERE